MFIKVEVDNFEQFEKDLQRVHELEKELKDLLSRMGWNLCLKMKIDGEEKQPAEKADCVEWLGMEKENIVCKIRKVNVEKIICIEIVSGNGTNENPIRASKIYYTIDGILIGEILK